jgi:exosortase D (VPLPA-CTERM-specific)
LAVQNIEIEKQKIINYAFPGVVTAAFVLAIIPVLQKLMIRWDTGDNSYCYLIVPLFLYLCWDKKGDFQFNQFSWNFWGLIPLFLSILLIIAGELGSMETLLYIGIWGCVIGILYCLYGLRMRQLMFPLLILAFIVPMPPFINQMLTFNLKLAASTLSVMLLRLIGVSVLQDGNIIDLGITQMQVVDACSGLRYFVPLILMALLFGYFYGRRLWQKIVLLVIVLPLSIVVNGARIFVTGMLHIWGYPELAENFFHDFSGWLVFMIAGAILFGVSLVLRKIGPDRIAPAVKDSGGRVVSVQRQLAITIVLCLVFVGSGWALQRLPSAANLPERSSFKSFPMEIGKWSARRNYIDDAILKELWADDYVSATYSRDGIPNTIQLLIPFYEYQGTRHTAHAPQSCMLGSGWALAESHDRSVDVGNGRQISVRVSLWKKGDYTIYGAYFFLTRGRVITSPWANKFYLIADAFTRQRTDGALVRMEVSMVPGQSISDADALLEDFLRGLWPVLGAYVPG